jgi:hypothetical protein
MEFGINVDSLRKSNELRETKIKKTNENDNYNIKMVEYTFFVQNEIEISKIISKLILDKNYDIKLKIIQLIESLIYNCNDFLYLSSEILFNLLNKCLEEENNNSNM